MYTGSGRDVKSLNGYAEREPFLQLRFNLIGSFRDLVKFVFIHSRGTRPRTHGKSEEKIN